jgi:hypothetical protein
MTLAWHIARKDLLLHRLPLAGLVVVAAISVTNGLVTPRVWSDPGWRTVTPLWMVTAILGYAMIWIVCIASLIQSDRLVGSTAFWLTRPISSTQLLAGKLFGLFAFVIAPALILDAIVMATHRVSPGVILLALLQEAWTLAIIALVIAFIAALTTTIMRVFLVIAVVITSELVSLQIAVSRMRGQFGGGGHIEIITFPFGYTNPNALLLGGTTFAIGVLIALAYQYRHRRRILAVGLFVLGLLVSGLPPGFSNSIALIQEPSVDHEPWAHDARASLRTVDLTSGRPISAETSLIRTGGGVIVIAAPVMLDGLPPGYVATPITSEAAMTFDDHTRLEPLAQTRNPPEIEINGRLERWAALANIEEATLRQRGSQPGTYRGTIDFIIERYTPIATFPVAVGATASDGARSVTVSGTQHESSGCALRLTTTEVTLLTQAREWPELVLGYRLRDGREMTDAYAPTPHNLQVFLGPRSAAGATSLLRAFGLNARTAYPMLHGEGHDTVHAACSDITMSVASVSYVGRLTRTLELHDFRLNDPFAGR